MLRQSDAIERKIKFKWKHNCEPLYNNAAHQLTKDVKLMDMYIIQSTKESTED